MLWGGRPKRTLSAFFYRFSYMMASLKGYCETEAGDPTACCADVGYQGKRKQELNLEREMVEFAKLILKMNIKRI